VSAPATGYLQRIELEPGDPVGRGTLITRMTGPPSPPLDPRRVRELSAALTAARAVETSARASLGQARRDLARAEALADEGIVSRAQLEENRTRVTTGQAALRQARGEVREIEASLTQSGARVSAMSVPVRSPAAGAIL